MLEENCAWRAAGEAKKIIGKPTVASRRDKQNSRLAQLSNGVVFNLTAIRPAV
jgi:hypothetical protein